MRAALLLAALGLPAMALARSPDVVAEGKRWWTESPDSANPVAWHSSRPEVFAGAGGGVPSRLEIEIKPTAEGS